MEEILFTKLVSAAQEAAAHAQGKAIAPIREYKIEVPKEIDVKHIRTCLGMTQTAFAAMFGFSLSGLRKWEAKERTPEGAARVLLKMISRDPQAVLNLAY